VPTNFPERAPVAQSFPLASKKLCISQNQKNSVILAPYKLYHWLYESVTYAFIWAGKMPNRVGNPNIMPSASVNCSILMTGMLGLGGAFIFVSTSSLRDSSTWNSDTSTPFASRPMYLQCVNYCGDYSSGNGICKHIPSFTALAILYT
jgi:hypothetical protein